MPALGEPRRRGRWSLRRVASLTIVTHALLGMLAILAVSSFAWTSRSLQRATDAAARYTRARNVATELQLSMHAHRRLSDLTVATNDARVAAARDEVEDDLRRLIDAAHGYVETPHEAVIVARIDDGLFAYLAERRYLEAIDTPLDDMVVRMRPIAQQTVDGLEALRSINHAELLEAQAQASGMANFSRVAAIVAIALITIGSLAAIVIMRRSVLQPTTRLYETVVRYRETGDHVRAPVGGSREIRELARAFNDLADARDRQRERELAFLGGVAHDLRNPLAGLKMAVFAARAQASAAGTPKLFDMLDRQLDHLTRMVSDLLDAARIEAGQLEMHMDDVDLRDVVSHVVELHAPVAVDHEIAVAMPPDPVIVRGDGVRLEQVVGNLLTNAMKFSPPGTGIEIALRVDARGPTLSVCDHGVGIADSELRDLFTPFVRGRAKSPGGTGLGLSVAQRIVTAHGGTIDVRSEPGSGSTFTIRLPPASRG